VSGNPVVSARPASSGDRRDAQYHEIGVDLTSLTAGAIHTTLAIHGTRPNASMMFMITEADADAIRAVYHEHGELSAAMNCAVASPGSRTMQKRGRSPDGTPCPRHQAP